MRHVLLACAAEHSLQVQVLIAPMHQCCFCCRMLARQVANSALPLQAWCAKALDAERAALGPAHPFTIRTLQKYAGCLGARVGWQQASEMLREHLAQLKAAGLGNSEGKQISQTLGVSCMGFQRPSYPRGPACDSRTAGSSIARTTLGPCLLLLGLH